MRTIRTASPWPRRRCRSRRRSRGRRWWRHDASSFESRTTRSHAGSTRRSTASSPSATPSATGWSPTASRRARSTIVHEGVDVDAIAAVPSGNVHAALFLPTRAPVVGNVGALVAQKDQHMLIDAAALVVRDVPDARFVILGEGELRSTLEDQIKHKHLERHVFLAGFRADVLELMKDFDVFALSSMQEGMCTALVDAMAAAKPAVATLGRRRAGGHRRRRDRIPCRCQGSPRDGGQDRAPAQGRGAAARGWAKRRCARRATAVYGRTDGRGDRGGVRGTGRHIPRSGHCESRCARLNPQAFIIPMWHREKS